MLCEASALSFLPSSFDPHTHYKLFEKLNNQIKTAAAVSMSSLLFLNIQPVDAGMLTFPLPAPLKNNIALVRSGECYADSRHEIQTNPVKKLRQDNSLTFKGREQAIAAADELNKIGFSPTYIWTSNTERAYETATIIARECQLGQNRIVPEYSFLDARSVGIFEGKNDEEAWQKIHQQDEQQGINFKAPENIDGTPSDSVSNVLVRDNQLVSTIESMYSGENVLIVSPDSDVLSILVAATANEDPDGTLPLHARYQFKNGEIRLLKPTVVVSDRLITGQTQAEADITNRKMKAMRVAGTSKFSKTTPDSWVDLWHITTDLQ
eukprot:gene5724-7907_t